MKRLILCAAAALMFTAAPALSVPQHDGSHGGGSHGGGGHASHGGGGHASHAGGGHGGGHSTGHRGDTSHGNRGGHRGSGHRGNTNHRGGSHGRNGHRSGSRGRTNVHVSVSLGGLRANVNSPRRYRFVGTYRRPGGWYARRWAYGDRLPGGWYGSDYWLGNYVTFGLMAPPDGNQWIREGNDAVLVNVNTGEIIRVEYGVFY